MNSRAPRAPRRSYGPRPRTSSRGTTARFCGLIDSGCAARIAVWLLRHTRACSTAGRFWRGGGPSSSAYRPRAPGRLWSCRFDDLGGFVSPRDLFLEAGVNGIFFRDERTSFRRILYVGARTWPSAPSSPTRGDKMDCGFSHTHKLRSRTGPWC